MRPEDEPIAAAGEVVFLGKSNVGKSALINRLLGASALARTSSTPGRTQTVNFYAVNERHLFVDLPGYGYARVPEAVRRAWGPMVEGFLTRRAGTIAAAVVLIDARHGVADPDHALLDWLTDREIPALVVGVKADKLSGNERTRAARRLLDALPVEDGAVAPFLVSAHSGLGIAALWRHLDAALAAHAERAGAGRKTIHEDGRWTSAS